LTLACRLLEPIQGSLVINLRAPAGVIHSPEIVLRQGVALIRSLAEVVHCSQIVFRDSQTSLVHHRQLVLRRRKTLIGCVAKTFERLLIVLLDSLTMQEAIPQSELRLGVPGIGGGTKCGQIVVSFLRGSG